VFEFKVVQSQWSDGAHVYLRELHKAERDTVDFYVEASRRCCRKLESHWHTKQQKQQQQQQEEAALAVAGARTHAQRRRSHRRHTEAAAHPAETATSSIPSALVASAASLVHDSSSSGVLQLPLDLNEKELELVKKLAAELSYKLGKDVEFSEGQRVALALSHWLPALALTGGPGCGKTLVSQAVAHNAHSWRRFGKFCMAAPTGVSTRVSQHGCSARQRRHRLCWCCRTAHHATSLCVRVLNQPIGWPATSSGQAQKRNTRALHASSPDWRLPYALCSLPAGRAAQRLLELSGSEDASASTIHRLLGYRNPGLQALYDAAKEAQQEAEEELLEELQEQLSLPQELDLGRFSEYNRRNPLPTGVVLVDEVSMMDITLAAALFNSLW
jgi:hypothetical protein